MGRILKAVPAALAVPGLLFVVSCGSGGEADDTSREIASEQLAQMVLALDQFGPEFAGFVPDQDEPTGALTIDQAAEEEDDPVAEKADLEQFGWVATHKASFENPNTADGQAAGLGSLIYLFQTPEGASNYISDSVAEMREIAREEGVEDLEVSELDIGQEAVSLAIQIEVERDDGSKIPFSAWAGAFRRGRLVGVVQIHAVAPSELENARLDGKVTELASVMNDRIASVLTTAAPAAAGQ